MNCHCILSIPLRQFSLDVDLQAAGPQFSVASSTDMGPDLETFHVESPLATSRAANEKEKVEKVEISPMT